MKSTMRIKGGGLLAGLLMLSTTALALPRIEEEFTDTLNFDTYNGLVVDMVNSRNLPFATIEAIGSNVATVSNIDGEFIIKIAKDSKVSELKISYIGFANEIVSLSDFKENRAKIIGMKPSAVQLKEITIRPQDALELMVDVLANIRENYSVDPMMMRGFYRETIQRGKNYASISEAVVDICVAGFGGGNP